MGETREDVNGEHYQGCNIVWRRADVKQADEEKERNVLNVVLMHASRTLDILIGKQLLGAWMRIGQRLLCILRITKSAVDLDHPKYSNPPLRHHLHDHQHRRDGKITKHWIVECEKIHVSMPRMNRFAVPETSNKSC